MRLKRFLLHITATLTCSASLLFSGASAAAIDAQCESATSLLIERINAEGLIRRNSAGQGRVKEIALELCSETEKLVREQHAVDKEKALENWFFESHPEKAGNRRLQKKR